jgi:hypothetical protein
MKPVPAPNVPGNTEAERFDNAVRKMFTEDYLKEEARLKKLRARRRTRKASCSHLAFRNRAVLTAQGVIGGRTPELGCGRSNQTEGGAKLPIWPDNVLSADSRAWPFLRSADAGGDNELKFE